MERVEQASPYGETLHNSLTVLIYCWADLVFGQYTRAIARFDPRQGQRVTERDLNGERRQQPIKGAVNKRQMYKWRKSNSWEFWVAAKMTRIKRATKKDADNEKREKQKIKESIKSSEMEIAQMWGERNMCEPGQAE